MNRRNKKVAGSLTLAGTLTSKDGRQVVIEPGVLEMPLVADIRG